MRYFMAVLAGLASLQAHADRGVFFSESGSGGSSVFILLLVLAWSAFFIRWPIRGFAVSMIVAGVAMIYISDVWIVGLPMAAGGIYVMYRILFVWRTNDV